MTINPNASQMLQAFIEAGQALDELPRVKADLASAQENISVGNQIIDHMTAEARAAQDKIDSLTAALAQKEAELSDITFRHSQMQNKFRTVADALGLVSAEVKPSAQPDPIDNRYNAGPQSDHVSGLGQSATDPTNLNPTTLPPHSESNTSLHGNSTEQPTTANPSQDQRDMDPTANSTNIQSPPAQPQLANENESASGDNTFANPSPASAVAAPAPNPTLSASPTENSGTTSPAADTPTGNVGHSGDGGDDATRWTSWNNPGPVSHIADHAASA